MRTMISASGSDSSSTTALALPKLPVTMDTRGRVRASREQRRVILDEFERSGTSAAQFARRAGLKYSTFAAWVHRYGQRKRPASKSPVRLLEAVVASAPLTSALEVQLPGGARLEVREASQIPLVAALVRALEKPC
jgi:transposase-like protein